MKIYIACYIWEYAYGAIFYKSQIIDSNAPPYTAFFTTRLPSGKAILWMVGVERMPKLSKDGEVIKASS